MNVLDCLLNIHSLCVAIYFNKLKPDECRLWLNKSYNSFYSPQNGIFNDHNSFLAELNQSLVKETFHRIKS